MTYPLISVIIPIYNTPKKYLKKCVYSVLQQSYKYFEILLVDDGSNASTQSYCEELSKIDKRIRVLRQKNGGVSSARNLGLFNARGNYITFLDSDDELAKCALERLKNLTETGDVDVVCAQITTSKLGWQTNSYGDAELIDGVEAALRLLYGKQIPGGLHPKLFSRQILKNQLFDTALSVAEDLQFNFHVFLHSKKIIVDPTPLYFYDTSTATSATRSPFKPSRMDALKAMRAMWDYSKGGQSDEIIAAIKYRSYIEALNALSLMGRREKYSIYEQACISLMKELRVSCLFNPKVNFSDKLIIAVSALSARMAVILYRVRYKLWLLTVRLRGK